MPVPHQLTPETWRRICAVLDRLREAGGEIEPAAIEQACGAEGLRVADVEPFLTRPEQHEGFLERLDPDLLAACARDLGDEPASLSAGDRLGPYEIEAIIGAGGMGEVYRGRDTRLNRQVALKLLQAHVAGHTDGQERFEHEARAISALNHPHICTLFDVGETQRPGTARPTSYLVMELLDGETLADRLDRGPLPITQAIEFTAQIAEALAVAHRHGVIHRDLKPSNIMLTTHGVKLLDFGIAALRHSADGASIDAPQPAEGAVVGTLDYMAPEQLAGAAGDARSDLFSLGAIAFEMLTGRRAFIGDTRAGLVNAVLEGTVPPISSERPGVPAAFDWAVSRCLAKDPEERWQSAADLARHVRWGADAGAKPASAANAGRRLLAAAAVLTLLGASAAAIFWPRRDSAMADDLVRYDIPPPEGATFERTLALSPDGRRIAFTATDGADHRALWIRPLLDAEVSKPVPGTDGAFYPFWSPDGRHVGFFADQKLKRVDLATGTVQVICDTGFGGGGTWNSDDVIVFATQSTTSPALLQRVSASGGVPETLTRQISKQTLHAWPNFLPDGRHYLYLRLELPEVSGIFMGALGHNEYEPVITRAFESRKVARALREAGQIVGRAKYAGGYLFFIRTGTLWAQRYDVRTFKLSGDPVRVIDRIAQDSPGRAAFDVSENGALVYRIPPESALNRLTWFDRSGRETGHVGDAGPYASPALSPDGRWILADRTGSPGPIVRIDATSGTPTVVTNNGMIPIWSPDGAELLYRGGGGPIVSAAKVDGSEPEGRPIGPAFNSWPGQWLKDGRFVGTAIRAETTSWDVFVKTVADSDATFIVSTRADETDPRVSPDGRWLAYAARDESRQWQLFVRPFDRGGRIERVSQYGGRFPRWSPSSNELFYVSPDGFLMRARVRSGSEFSVTGIDRLFPHEGLSDHYSAGFDSPYDLAADGRILVAVPVKRAKPVPVSVILNWPAFIKR